MTTIYADFNARTADDRIRLDPLGSKKSIAAGRVAAGTWVWVTDGEVRAGAHAYYLAEAASWHDTSAVASLPQLNVYIPCWQLPVLSRHSASLEKESEQS